MRVWNQEQTFYGLGQDIAFPMIQTAPPPSPPPSQSTPPSSAPSKYVSLIMRTTTTHSIVLSWKSLDHGQPVEHHLNDLALSHHWVSFPLYMRRFDGIYFCIWHPSLLAIPKVNQPLGTLDSAMIAAFTTHFAEMNQEIIDSIARARLNPVSAPPPDPNSRKFFRLVADWTLDSDFDMRPDWLEFMAMQGRNGMQLVTTAVDENGNSFQITANPFGDAYTPSGGLVGKVADSDQDGVSDVADVHPSEPLLNWERASFRYAMFPVTIPDAEEAHDRRALQANALGQVLFRHSVWRNAVHTALNTEGLEWAHSLAMNDHGHILGNSSFPYSETTSGNAATTNTITALSWWTAAHAVPTKIKAASPQGGDVFAGMTEAHYWEGIKGEEIFGDSGRFCALTVLPMNLLQPNPPPTEPVTALWSRNEAGQYSYQEVEQGLHFVNSETHAWKFPDENGSTIVDNQTVTALVSKFVRLPTGPQIACTHDHPRSKSYFKTGSGGWKTLPDLESLKDFSPTGIGITAENLLWINRALLPIKSMAPSADGAENVWNDYELLDLSPKGHLLAAKESPSSNSSNAPAHTATVLGYPFSLEDNEPATGVDNLSQTTIPSDAENNGFQEKLWVMAPQGTWLDPVHGTQPNSNRFTIKAPLDDLTATFTLNNATSTNYELTGNSTVVELTGTGTSTTDGNITISMNGNTSQSFPIGVKSMKRRTVNVHLYRCQHATTVTPGVDDPYDYDVAAMTAYLDKVFGSQINAYFSVTESDLVAGQDGNPSPLYPTIQQDEVNYISTAAIDEMIETLPFPENADIRVYAVGHMIRTSNSIASGIAPEDTNTVFLEPMRIFENNPDMREEYAMRTLAHEIGHVICGSGHPDEGYGPAILPGTDHCKRLMCSGNVKHDSTSLLVKREWDMAEAWLKAVPDKRIRDDTGSLPDSY